MKACPVCGGPVRSVALTALEEAAQAYPHVSAAWRCAAWPACDTRRVESSVAGARWFIPATPGTYHVTIDRASGRVVDVEGPESRPRDSDIGGPAWGTRR
jgi:hypothetical protein